jgi:hypothetical protein
MATERVPWNKSLRRNQFCNFFLEKGIFLGNSRPMNQMVLLNLRDFFFCKSYGHLIGWSRPVHLGYDVLDLGYDVLDWVMTFWTWTMMSWIWAMTSLTKLREYEKEDKDKSQE